MLSFGVCHQLNLEHAELYSLFIFSATFFTYNVQRFIKERQTISSPTNHIIWLRNHKKQQYIVTTLSFIILVFAFFKIYSSAILGPFILSISVLISIFYVFPIQNKSLRDVPYLKIHLIAIICVIAVGGFQLLNENNFDIHKWQFVGIHYFYILAVTIPFDIRDLDYDQPSQKTIPQLLGLQNAKILSVILVWAYYIFSMFLYPCLLNNLFFLLSIVLTTFLILFIRKNRPDFYFSGLIEFSIFIVGSSFLLT
jgi:1,4-dihydroxy-2-naphthoate octaprenyltransferase